MLQSDATRFLGEDEHTVDEGEVVVEVLNRDALRLRKIIRVLASLAHRELGRMERVEERIEPKHVCREAVVGLEVVRLPIRIVEHDLDVRPLGDHLVEPALVAVVGGDAVVERGGLLIGD